MRLQEIREILLRNIERLDVFPDPVKGRFELKNLNDFRTAVDELEKLNLFYEQISTLKESFLFKKSEDSMFVELTAWREIQSSISSLKYLAQKLIDTLDIKLDEDENTVAIKLTPIKDFDDLIVISNELKKAISIPISEEGINGKVTIQAVDNSSIWFYVALGTPAALTLVAGLAWAATVIYKKLQEGYAFNEYVKNLQLKNEQTEAFIEAQKQQVQLLIAEQAKLIEKKHFTKSDSERLERLKLSITTMSELIDKGFEIHPSLMTPESVKNLFPDFKTIHFPSFETKQISSGSNSELNPQT
jgi:hypothetical protein